MFNLYQSMQARAQKDHTYASTGSLEMSTTGHDRFCQLRPSSSSVRSIRRKRRAAHRRAQSAAEFDCGALQAANAFVGAGSPNSPSRNNSPRRLTSRSSSLEETCPAAACERTPLRPHSRPESPEGKRLPSLASLLSCVSLTGVTSTTSNKDHNMKPHTNARHGGSRYEYTALEDGSNQQERLELERKAQRSAAREKAHTTCQVYLRNSSRYVMLEQLNDIGSRLDKHWFVVKDTSVKTERLLALVPRNANSPIPCSAKNREALQELFVALQHPYIYPVLDLDFQIVGGNTYVLSILPLNSKGSLKDLIYRSRWQDDWSLKYGQRSTGLPLSQVQRLGRQILEALLFLRDRGFPPCGHLHSGNIVLQNGVARLTGLENTLLGYTSRIHPVIWGRARSDPSAIDTICFGHIMFEMCAGYELCTPQPTPGHILDIQDYPQVQQVLEFIFQNPHGRYPSIEEISLCDFFRNIDLRELRAMPLPMFQARLTPKLASLLHDVKAHQKGRRSRRSHSASTADSQPRENVSPLNCERRSSNPIASTSRGQLGDVHRAAAGNCSTSSGSEEAVCGSPVPSIYTTPHTSMSGLVERARDSPLGVDSSCSDDDAADDEQSDFSPVKEHRGLSIQVRQPACTLISSCSTRKQQQNCDVTSCLTRRMPSTS